MIKSTALAVVSLSIVAASLIACSADVPSTSGAPLGGSTSSTTPARGESPNAGALAGGDQAPGTDGKGGAAASGTSGSDTDGGASGKTGGKGEGEPPPPSDPACVASCNSGLKAKCQGDDQFCEDVCSFATAQEVACLVSAPTCDKTEWVRCMPDNGGGNK